MNSLWLKLKESFQNQPEPTTKQAIGGWAVIICVGLAVWSLVKSPGPNTAQLQATQKKAAPQSSMSKAIGKADSENQGVTDNIADEIPKPMSHNYATEDNGVYGYEQDISDADKMAGVAAKPMIMVRYLGEKNGRYTVVFSDNDAAGGSVNYASCSAPCNYIRLSVVFNGQTLHSEMMPAGQSIAAAIMEDAITGQLKPYHNKHRHL